MLRFSIHTLFRSRAAVACVVSVPCHVVQAADELFTLPQRPVCQSLGLLVHSFLLAIAPQSGSLLARCVLNTSKYCSEVHNTPEPLDAESPSDYLSRCGDIPRDKTSDHIRPPLCLNLSPVVGVGFSALNNQRSRSSAGNSTRKMPLQRYAAQATTVAISASIQ